MHEKNPFEKEQILLIPEAYLEDKNDPLGWRIVAKIAGTNEYVLLTPPNYSIEPETTRGELVKTIAISKHRFLEFKSPKTKTNDIKTFIKEIQKSSK